MELYRGIRLYPMKIWKIYKRFPKTKIAYYKIRNLKNSNDLAFRAARTLYLNRTCFKGMWRYNSRGEFNIGYGGQSRRWVINYKNLHYVSTRLKNKSLKCCDFESIIDNCTKDDFIFLDPPYRPGNCEMIHSHYTYSNFEYDEHKRLAAVLKRATKKGVRWILTNSSHPRILHLFRDNWINFLQLGTGNKLGKLTKNPNEVLIRNYKEVFR
jgi:DNA adenine methylase